MLMSKTALKKIKNKCLILIIALIVILLVAFVLNLGITTGDGYSKNTVKEVIQQIHEDQSYISSSPIDLGENNKYTELIFESQEGFEYSVTTGKEPITSESGQWDGVSYRDFLIDGYIDGYLKQDEGQNKIKEIASSYSDVTLETDEYEDREVVVALSTENLDTYESLCNDMKEAFQSYWVDQSEALGDINYGINCNFMIIYESGELYTNKIQSLGEIVTR